MKKVLLLFTAFMLAANAWADDQDYDIKFGDVYYRILDYEEYTLEVVQRESYKDLTTIVISEPFDYGTGDDRHTYTVTRIGDCAFQQCQQLTSITIPSTVTEIGTNAFQWAALQSITLPESLKVVRWGAFIGCPFKSIVFPEGVTEIENSALAACNNLTTVSIPNSIIEISNIFWGLAPNIQYNKSGNAKYLGNEENPFVVLMEANNESLINENCLIIASNAFDLNTIASLSIPNSVKFIKGSAFYHCTDLTSVKIPSSVTFVGTWAFQDCPNVLVMCEAQSQPESWENGWNYYGDGVNEKVKCIWNYKNKAVTVNVNGTGTGTVTADHDNFVYEYGQEAILTATPNEDSKFVGWSDGNHDNPRKIIVKDNDIEGNSLVNTYTATFYPKSAETYEIIVTVKGKGSVSGDGIYLKDGDNPTSVTLTATSANADLYHFVGWSNGTEYVSTNAEYTFNTTANVSLTAVFEGQTVAVGSQTVHAIGKNTDNCTFHPTITGQYKIELSNSSESGVIYGCFDEEGNQIAEISSDRRWMRADLVAGKAYSIGAGFYETEGDLTLKINNPEYEIIGTTPGNGKVLGSGVFSHGASATLTATADEGYHFKQWEDNAEEPNPRSIEATESGTYTALFEINTYTIAIAIAENGTTSGAGTYTHGQSVTLTASAAEGYHFVGWGDGNSDNPRIFKASGDLNLTPTFAINQYTVSVEFEHGSVTGTGTYTHGQTAHLVASASEGFEFAGWSDECETAERDTVVTSNIAIRAIFINQGDHLYNIKVATPENGTIAGDGKYIVGTTATLHAYAAEGYHFVGWGDGNTDTLRIFTVTADMQLTPSFAINQYTVAVSKADNGTVTGAATYNHGDAVKVVATANTGYHFAGWSTGETSDTLKFTATRDTAFTPSFEINTYKVTAVAEKGSVAGAHTYTHGSDATITAYPEDGYHFVKWADGVESATRTLVVLKDTAFTALFEINKYTASVAESAHGSVSGAGEYTHGQTATFAATADAGYEFLFWSDGSKVNPRTVKMTKDVEMRAVFSLEGHSAFNVTLGSSAHGTVTGGGLYIEGETATLTAKPESAAYHFVAWSDNNTQNPRNVVVDKEISLTATFAINTYTVKAATHENETDRGSVTGGGTYNYGDMATLRATPAEGFRFTNWSDGDVYNIKYLNITKDTAFTAHFAPAVGTDTVYVDKIIEKIQVKTDTIRVKEIIKDTVTIEGTGNDTVYVREKVYLNDTVFVHDTIYITKTDTVYIEKETGKPTAINAVAATAVNIYAHHNTIVVENAEDEIRVYDAMGKLICRDAINRVRAELRVNGTGIYIVKTGNTAKRVMVKE